MHNKKIYICLYYFALLLSIFVCIIPSVLPKNFVESDPSIELYSNLSIVSVFLIIINVVIVIIFTIMLIKKSLKNINILFPIIYIAFTIIVLVICVLFNNRLIIPYIQYSYYIKFILINYILLNIYSLLSINSN